MILVNRNVDTNSVSNVLDVLEIFTLNAKSLPLMLFKQENIFITPTHVGYIQLTTTILIAKTLEPNFMNLLIYGLCLLRMFDPKLNAIMQTFNMREQQKYIAYWVTYYLLSNWAKVRGCFIK